MSIGKSILVWIMTGLIAIAAFFANIFGLTPPTMPDCLTTTTAIVTTVTTAATRAPVTFTVDRDGIMTAFAGGAQEVTQLCKSTNSIGVATERSFTGVALKRVLVLKGVNLGDITAAATLVVTAPHNDITRPDIVVTYSYAEFMDETTLLAWYQVDNGNIDLDPMRIVLKDALSGKFVTGPASLTLNYNA